MTNFERLKKNESTEAFWTEVVELSKHRLAPYIDFPAFLRSEDPNVLHFVKKIGRGMLLPSEAEMLACGCQTEASKLLYQQSHKKRVFILEDTSLYGKPYYTVCDVLGIAVEQVPVSCVTQIELEED